MLALALARAQPLPTFEAASVKPAGPFVPGPQMGARGGPGTADPGRFAFGRASLLNLLTLAYGVGSDRISGPSWIGDIFAYGYAIETTMPPTTTRDNFRLMLQNLLAERFHLRLHRQTRTRAGYEMVLTKGGPKLKQWAAVKDAAKFKPGVDANGFPTLDPAAPSGVAFNANRSEGTVRVTFRGSVADFCRELESPLRPPNGSSGDPEPVIADRTGLAGVYTFRLEYAAAAMPSAPSTDAAAIPIASAPGTDISAAIEKQLGLKLVKVKGAPVDMLIIDHADKAPTEN